MKWNNDPQASQLICTDHLGKGSGWEATGEIGGENKKGIHKS